MKEVIFQNIFGADWEKLPIVFKKHYANRGFSNDITKTIGNLEIDIAPALKLFAPLLSHFGTLLPYSGKGAVCKVDFVSHKNDNHFRFNRRVEYQNGKMAIFNSRLEYLSGNEVVEFTKSGIGWLCSFDYDGEKVNLRHKAYCIKLFGKIIRLPLELLFGKGMAYETAIDNDNFAMYMEMRHSIFGKLYGYSGRFQIISVQQND